MEPQTTYRLIFDRPHRKFLDIDMTVNDVVGNKLRLQLPAWRPGRYELAHFAKNVQRFSAFGNKGQELSHRKLTKDLWEIDCEGCSSVSVSYNYYSETLNAGSTYVSGSQLYVNPVNCLMYVPGRIDMPVEVRLDIPTDWQVACAMKQPKEHMLVAKDYHELADSPFIASGSLQHCTFEEGGVLFHLWFQGEFKPEWERITGDFRKFCGTQIATMGDFPVKEYHFLFQIRTHSTYHGVEHCNSTVITLGPSYDILKPVLYDEFLGISSHELFHAWNVKALRPADMLPYDYTHENYTRLGYVTEGVTTYAGDLMLYRSGAFNDYDFFKNIHKLFQRHFHNYGRFNLSVADSSFDTWLDGYDKGIPDRKTSIYTEGAMLAMMLDISMLKDTGNRHGLMGAMRLLYERFAKQGKGYTEADYRATIEELAERDYSQFFSDYYHGTTDMEPLLTELLEYVGISVRNIRSRLYFENRFGFKVSYPNGTSAELTEVAPMSIADRAGLRIGDEVTAINGISLQGNLKEWCKYFMEEPIDLTVITGDDTHKVELAPTEERYYRTRWPEKSRTATEAQQAAFKAWTGRDFGT
ncbi:MAG: PDZ domain-containing protein [Flavobacteriales bacterium]|nr:PDZ domain-containing protein [Flavobacteriales bacterium]